MKKSILIIAAIFTVSIARAQDIPTLADQIKSSYQQVQVTYQGTISALNAKNTVNQRAIDSLNAVIAQLSSGTVVTPPPVIDPPSTISVTPPVITKTVNLGDGKSGLTIDGKKTKYAQGTNIVIKPGTYKGGITLSNLTGVMITGDGVILDGLNQTKAGFYNNLNINNVTNVWITGFTTQNNGYRMVNINTRTVGLTFDKCTFINNLQGISMSQGYVSNWDGTDNTVNLLNFSITNCRFINCDGGVGLAGGVSGSVFSYVTKNFLFAGNYYHGGNPGDIIWGGAVDGYSIHDNVVDSVNMDTNDDTRLFMMTGNGDAYNNTFNDIEGHAVGCWPITFGTTPKTCHYYNNKVTNSRRYSAFEFQEFPANYIPGVSTYADLVVDNNIAGNINTDHWTGYPGTFIDCYQWGQGGHVTLTNNKGYNWWPVPALPTLWNLAQPTVILNNTYTDK